MVQVNIGYSQLINQLNEFESIYFGVPGTELLHDVEESGRILFLNQLLSLIFVTQS